MATLSVREIQRDDIALITGYWLESTPGHLQGMGVDLDKMPTRMEWEKMLLEQLVLPYKEKKSYCIIWEVDGIASGHSNINKIEFGKEAYMHLHLWDAGLRKKGLGTELIRLTLPRFFENYQLQHLYSEPYALNPPPHKVLEKAGFTLVREYITVPGAINFEQPVKLWKITRENYLSVRKSS
jgi:RimJ/RimL family protein N-acetyltransferase